MPDRRIVFAFDKQSARSIDADGRMRVKNCILSTAEINPYRGEEIPGWQKLGLKSGHVYELYRDPEELKKACASFEGVPLMIKHIPQTADEPRKEYQAGSVHTIRFEGKHLRGDLLVTDGAAIDLIESDELSDLSCGYRYDPVMQSGEADGSKYDGVMRNIQGNHVALVDDGRASGAHVADSALRNPQSPNPSMSGADTMPDPVQPQQPGANPPPGTPQGEGNEQANMAAIGQALKHIAGLLEQALAKNGGEGTPAPGADEEFNEGDEEEAERRRAERSATGNPAGAADTEPRPPEGAMDDDVINPPGSNQEGTPARGAATPHGAMDARSVRKHTELAVANAIKQERARNAAIAEAAREVRGILGDVYGMDSAAAIYREALTVAGIDVKAIPQGGERTAWQAYKAVQGVQKPRTEMAMDSKEADASRSAIAAHLARIQVRG
ncbi:head maturation protease [Ralstonia phage PQ43W]